MRLSRFLRSHRHLRNEISPANPAWASSTLAPIPVPARSNWLAQIELLPSRSQRAKPIIRSAKAKLLSLIMLSFMAFCS